MNTTPYKKNKIEFLSEEIFRLFNHWTEDTKIPSWLNGNIEHANPETYDMLNHAWGVDDANEVYSSQQKS